MHVKRQRKIIVMGNFLLILAFCTHFYDSVSANEDLYNQASEKEKAGLYTEAITIYTDLIKRDSKDLRFYAGRGICFRKIGQYKKAISDWAAVLKSDPNDSAALRVLADLNNRNGSYDQTITYARRAIKINPQDESAYYD